MRPRHGQPALCGVGDQPSGRVGRGGRQLVGRTVPQVERLGQGDLRAEGRHVPVARCPILRRGALGDHDAHGVGQLVGPRLALRLAPERQTERHGCGRRPRERASRPRHAVGRHARAVRAVGVERHAPRVGGDERHAVGRAGRDLNGLPSGEPHGAAHGGLVAHAREYHARVGVHDVLLLERAALPVCGEVGAQVRARRASRPRRRHHVGPGGLPLGLVAQAVGEVPRRARRAQHHGHAGRRRAPQRHRGGLGGHGVRVARQPRRVGHADGHRVGFRPVGAARLDAHREGERGRCADLGQHGGRAQVVGTACVVARGDHLGRADGGALPARHGLAAHQLPPRLRGGRLLVHVLARRGLERPRERQRRAAGHRRGRPERHGVGRGGHLGGLLLLVAGRGRLGGGGSFGSARPGGVRGAVVGLEVAAGVDPVGGGRLQAADVDDLLRAPPLLPVARVLGLLAVPREGELVGLLRGAPRVVVLRPRDDGARVVVVLVVLECHLERRAVLGRLDAEHLHVVIGRRWAVCLQRGQLVGLGVAVKEGFVLVPRLYADVRVLVQQRLDVRHRARQCGALAIVHHVHVLPVGVGGDCRGGLVVAADQLLQPDAVDGELRVLLAVVLGVHVHGDLARGGLARGLHAPNLGLAGIAHVVRARLGVALAPEAAGDGAHGHADVLAVLEPHAVGDVPADGHGAAARDASVTDVTLLGRAVVDGARPPRAVRLLHVLALGARDLARDVAALLVLHEGGDGRLGGLGERILGDDLGAVPLAVVVVHAHAHELEQPDACDLLGGRAARVHLVPRPDLIGELGGRPAVEVERELGEGRVRAALVEVSPQGLLGVAGVDQLHVPDHADALGAGLAAAGRRGGGVLPRHAHLPAAARLANWAAHVGGPRRRLGGDCHVWHGYLPSIR